LALQSGRKDFERTTASGFAIGNFHAAPADVLLPAHL
jgi:hypothetical protein